MAKKVFIDLDFGDNSRIRGLLDGDTFRAAATVQQLNVAVSGVSAGGGVTQEQVNTSISGHLTGDPHVQYLLNDPATTSRNEMSMTASDSIPISILGASGGHTAELQKWTPDQSVAGVYASVTLSGSISALGFHSQGYRMTDVGAPVDSGDATNLDYVTARDTLVLSTATTYTDNQIIIFAFAAASAYQPLNPLLSSLSTTVHTANQLFYAVSGNLTESTNITPLARTLISGVTTSEMRSTLGLGNASIYDYGTASGTLALGDHRHAVLFDDFTTLRGYSTEWSETSSGAGSSFVHNLITGSDAWMSANGGDGMLRVSNGGGTAATDKSYQRPQGYSHFGDNFWGSGRRHLWRYATSASTSVKHSFGIMGGTTVASSVTPSPSFAFVIDSANANVRFQHDDNQGNTTDTDTGVSIASVTQNFVWAEINVVSGAVTALIDGVQVASITSNHPVGNDRNMYPFFYAEGNGGTWRSLTCDVYMMFGDTLRFSNGIYP